MASYNKLILVGNLTRDPELKYLPNQTAICSFGLAANRKYKGANGEEKEDVLFIDCSCFGKAGETINQYCRKGKPILIEGRLRYETWSDKNTGDKRNKISAIVENFQFLGGRDDAPGNDGKSVRQRATAPVSSPVSDDPEFDSESIPF